MPSLSPEARTALFYLTMFLPGGLMAVYSGLWMESRGLSPAEVGWMNAAPLGVMLLLNVSAGRVADRAPDWRGVIVACSVLAAALPLGLLAAQGFWALLVVWTLAALPNVGILPVTDAAAQRMATRRDADFGAIRAWGTVGYLGVLMGGAAALGALGPAAFVPALAALCALRAGAALALPRFRAPEAVPTAGARTLRQMARPWFLLPLAGWSLIFATHLVINAFQGLLWTAQGLSVVAVGLLIALGAASETAAFFAYRRLFGRWRPRTLILASALLSAGRWGLMALSPPLPLLLVLQASHGLTYAMGFLACLAFIARHTSEEVAAQAQGLFTTLQQGMSALAMLLFGALMGPFGAGAHWGSAALAAAGALAVWGSRRLHPA